ncbi:hypothetical protein QYF36_009615 [Acer negundo]|nr:hypothetical protein QYF36_009615 [Acer negundo]
MTQNNFNARMLKLIEEEEDDDYGILLGMAAVEGERLAIESRGPRRGGSLPGHAVSVRDRVEVENYDPYFVQRMDCSGRTSLSSIQKIIAAMRMLAYRAPTDSMDDCL